MPEGLNVVEVIHALSHRLIMAQHPVRILEAVSWTGEVRDLFFRAPGLSMQNVDKEWY